MSIDEVLKIHKILTIEFGGLQGVRDMSLLESAVFRPLATFGGIDLYPEPVDKAAALFESIIINHPFFDGNKRVGYVLLRLTLLDANKDINATLEERYKFVVYVAEGKHTKDSIVNWILNHLIEL